MGSNEQWTSRTTHTGDDAPFLSYDERFEHPARTWASSSHRKFTHAAVGIAMAAATFRFMQATASRSQLPNCVPLSGSSAEHPYYPPGWRVQDPAGVKVGV